ncbi:MAG: VWA domain-containing protein [Spirochaetales bacterium]|nr:VWA domain-containing protein [Spirochaetales bacterium]
MRLIKIVSVLLLLSCAFCLSAIALPLELIVMVDTSNSMEQYFDDLVHYVITDILKKNLHPGDTFHLIRFSEYPVHELTEVISNDEVTDTIIKKITFLKAKLFFGKYTDILSALQFLILYAEGLPKRNTKKLLMLSDFVHNPPADSPFSGISMEELEAELAKQARTIRERDGWSIRFIRFPARGNDSHDQIDETTSDTTDTTGDNTGDTNTTGGSTPDTTRDRDKDTADDATSTNSREPVTDDNSSNDDSTGTRTKSPAGDDEKDVIDIISDTFDTDIPTFDENEKEDMSHRTSGFPRLEFPGDLGSKGRIFDVPFIIHNYVDDEIVVKLRTLEYAGQNILTHNVPAKFVGPKARKKFKVTIKLPSDIKEGPCTLPVSLSFDDDNRIAPRQGTLVFYYSGDKLVAFFNFIGENFTVILFVLIIVIIFLIIFIFIRMRVFEGVFSDLLPAGDWRGSSSGSLLEGENLIEMRVSFQNPHIGFRNIHKIENNKAFTVGGGFSSFLIFLIPMPSHIAEIENIEGTYIFTPIKQEFFPDLKGPVEHCLNKEIPLVSSHGYRTTITFKEYESPLSRINTLLHSYQHEG